MKLPKVAENDAEGVFRMCPKFGPVPLMELLCQLMGKHSLSGVISWLPAQMLQLFAPLATSCGRLAVGPFLASLRPPTAP